MQCLVYLLSDFRYLFRLCPNNVLTFLGASAQRRGKQGLVYLLLS